MFNPGETVVHQFVIPFYASELSKVVVSYKQGDDIVLEKTITSGFDEDVDPTKTKVTVTLSQSESLMFRELSEFSIQLNVINNLGSRSSSKAIKNKNGVQYHKEVITP